MHIFRFLQSILWTTPFDLSKKQKFKQVYNWIEQKCKFVCEDQDSNESILAIESKQNNLLMFKIQKIKLYPKLYNKSYLNFFFNN